MEFFFFWLECFLAAVVSANYFIGWLQLQQKNKNISDDRILQLERIAYKGQPTKHECLALQTELSEVCLFDKRT